MTIAIWTTDFYSDHSARSVSIPFYCTFDFVVKRRPTASWTEFRFRPVEILAAGSAAVNASLVMIVILAWKRPFSSFVSNHVFLLRRQASNESFFHYSMMIWRMILWSFWLTSIVYCPSPPSWWHLAQWSWTSGAMSSTQVGSCAQPWKPNSIVTKNAFKLFITCNVL